MKIHKDIFDKKWLDELSYSLMDEPWFASNIANRKTWPYGLKGTHLLLGQNYFKRIDIDHINYGKNLSITNNLIASFSAIENRLNQKMELQEIATNLQFHGMDGTLHKDSHHEDDYTFILTISNELITEDMGGEFHHQPTETLVPFKFGNVIEIKGLDFHRGLAFKKPYIPRISVKYVGRKNK